jgi:hypothetical protein
MSGTNSALIYLEIEMTNTQSANSKGEAEALKDTANKVSQISTTPEKDALSEQELDQVTGGNGAPAPPRGPVGPGG